MKNMSALFLLLLTSQVFGGELIVSEPFDVLVVNGKDFGFSLRKTQTVKLQPGRNVIILEYDDFIDAEIGDGHDRVKSAPFALVFDAPTDAKLQLTGAHPSKLAEARAYSKNPEVDVKDASNQSWAFEKLPVSEVNGVLMTDNTRPAAPMTTTAVPPPSAKSAVETSTATAPDALQMLRYWWQTATKEQREAFLRELVQP